ncbi:hypothetical protein PVL29_008999 [Vitis rotundifolia]|uniref:Uncharacterized protein n=1 Tax=Vitis rotundifolia TaxID=103349 RepID=A0AA38ZXB4_VITRO|nr:hypothetical protein PVL29_008999 [Vitis rotundifolia]
MLLLHQTGSLNLSLVSCNSSPISPSVNVGHKGLAYASCNNNDEPSCSLLQTLPSFSFYCLSCMNEDEDSDEEEEKDEEEQEALEENDGERFMAMGDDEFSIENIKMMGFIWENGVGIGLGVSDVDFCVCVGGVGFGDGGLEGNPNNPLFLRNYLVWELHQDQDRASSYFKRLPLQTEEEEDDDGGACHVDTMPPLLHGFAMASANKWLNLCSE